MGRQQRQGLERAQAAGRARRSRSVDCGDQADHPSGPVSGGAVDAATSGGITADQPRGEGTGK